MPKIKLVVIALLSLCNSVNCEEIDIMIARLIPALIQVESNGDSKAIGDKGKALGQLQIWSVVVQDANRIGKRSYVHTDAYDTAKAVDICTIYLTYYGKRYTKATGKACTLEVLARMWNGGPKGYTKSSTNKYWYKVKAML